MKNSKTSSEESFDKAAIGARFFSCYPKMTLGEISAYFGYSDSYVVAWRKGLMPWKILKILSDSQGISWDWLLEGHGDKYSQKGPKTRRVRNPRFSKQKINQRFFSLFGDITQTEIAQTLGIAVSTVNGWRIGRLQVPWRWLKYVVDIYGVRWNWLIDGITPVNAIDENGDVNNKFCKLDIQDHEVDFDKLAISHRFFSCYPDFSKLAVARFFKTSQSFVVRWHTHGDIPWSKLKYLSDSQAISWDWLLEGIEPRESIKAATTRRSMNPTFPVAQINKRFFSLFPKVKQTTIANLVGVDSSTVSNWKYNRAQVPWRRLAAVVRAFNVRWDWLIDGLLPKHRE